MMIVFMQIETKIIYSILIKLMIIYNIWKM